MQDSSLPAPTKGSSTLKPPPVPSRLVSTVPGFGVLHWLHVLRRAQLRLAQPGQVQSSGENKPACIGGSVSIEQISM